MPRQLDPTMAAALATNAIQPFMAAALTFASKTVYCWSGVGTLVISGQTYEGIGSLAKVGTIQEAADSNSNAYGTTVTLSGIDPDLLQESMTDCQPGAAAMIWFGLLANGVILGTPYLVFSGTMDQPTITWNENTISITLALETKILDLQRARNSRYTQAEQARLYPSDIAFQWVPGLQDTQILWGSS